MTTIDVRAELKGVENELKVLKRNIQGLHSSINTFQIAKASEILPLFLEAERLFTEYQNFLRMAQRL